MGTQGGQNLYTFRSATVPRGRLHTTANLEFFMSPSAHGCLPDVKAYASFARRLLTLQGRGAGSHPLRSLVFAIGALSLRQRRIARATVRHPMIRM
jgi:hypothetical protein